MVSTFAIHGLSLVHVSDHFMHHDAGTVPSISSSLALLRGGGEVTSHYLFISYGMTGYGQQHCHPTNLSVAVINEETGEPGEFVNETLWTQFEQRLRDQGSRCSLRRAGAVPNMLTGSHRAQCLPWWRSTTTSLLRSRHSVAKARPPSAATRSAAKAGWCVAGRAR
jgi:hypothetical protein